MFCRKCGKEVQGNEEYCERCKEAMKKPCPYCGKKVDPNARFCEHCEAYLGEEKVKKTQRETTQTKKCRSCWNIIPKNFIYCPICKKMADTAPAPIQHQNAPNSYIDTGSYGAGFALGILVGLIGLIIGIAIGKSETKRGAIHGFLVELILSVVLCFAICSFSTRLIASYY